MIKNNRILLGKAEEKEIYLNPNQMNRHGLIAGASGTGKTVTLKVIAESLSEIGVPTVIADVKGDLSGMINIGNQEKIQERLTKMGIDDFECRKFPVHFFDIYQKNGHPIRSVLEQMGPMLLSRIMDLSDVQQGVLNIIFKIAEDMQLNVIDLKDLQAMSAYVGERASEFTVKYGNITKQSVGAIQRKLLELESQGGNIFFGQPALNIEDWMCTEGGLGVMNIIECQELFLHPFLYATFLFWMLEELYRKLPEVGDLEKPKLVFFFDEAHALFEEAPKQLLTKIEQTVKLIRSKGVGIFFITQNPADIPNAVLGQLSNRIQHSLRAYTPSEIKSVKLAADAFRQNPAFDTSEMITNMKTGTALVSVLDAEGAPTMVEVVKICPPKSDMGIAQENQLQGYIQSDSIYGKYEKSFDAESAYEAIDDIQEAEELEKQKELEKKKQEKLDTIQAKEEAREEARRQREAEKRNGRLVKKVTNKLENEALNLGIRSAKKFLKNFFK